MKIWTEVSVSKTLISFAQNNQRRNFLHNCYQLVWSPHLWYFTDMLKTFLSTMILHFFSVIFLSCSYGLECQLGSSSNVTCSVSEQGQCFTLVESNFMNSEEFQDKPQLVYTGRIDLNDLHSLLEEQFSAAKLID